MLPQQQAALREDFTLEMWNTMGKALHRNEQILRKEARDRKRQFGESLSEYAGKKLAMLQEAFGRNRDAADLIVDIKDGLTPADQEAIHSDLLSTPTIGKFMEELVRLDKIRGPHLKAALSTGKSPQAAGSGRQHRQSPYPSSPHQEKTRTCPRMAAWGACEACERADATRCAWKRRNAMRCAWKRTDATRCARECSARWVLPVNKKVDVSRARTMMHGGWHARSVARHNEHVTSAYELRI
jgi:hypothetical protein